MASAVSDRSAGDPPDRRGIRFLLARRREPSQAEPLERGALPPGTGGTMETVVIDGVSRTSALPADAVATRIADEFAAEDEPLHVRIGADAGRMIAAVEAGEREYHRYLVEDLGFSWLPLGRADAGER
jgi:hypothetical protein